MGCPLCKDRPATTGNPAIDYFVRGSAQLRSSRRGENTSSAAANAGSTDTGIQATILHHQQQQQQHPNLRNCVLEFQQPSGPYAEPPLYFLSGNPAIVHAVPPQKAPRASGWRDAKLTAPKESAPEPPPNPSRPPRKRQYNTQLSQSSSNTLQPPGLSRNASSVSLPRDMVLPEETANRLEAYLKKNQSFSSLNILMSQLQSRNIDVQSLGSSSGDEPWTPTCWDLGVEHVPNFQKSSSPPAAPSRSKRSIEPEQKVTNGYFQDQEKKVSFTTRGGDSSEEEDSSEHESFVLRGHWEDQDEDDQIIHPHHHRPELELIEHPLGVIQPVSPTKSHNKPPTLNLKRLTSVEEYGNTPSRPGTPGPWFDSGTGMFPSSPSTAQLRAVRFSPTKSPLSRSPTHQREEMTNNTPPPSENDDTEVEEEQDEEYDDVPCTKDVTHSVLLRILQEFSDDFRSNKAFSRRQSIATVSLSGIHQAIHTLQPEADETSSITPSIGELEAALAELLESEKNVVQKVSKNEERGDDKGNQESTKINNE